MASNEELNLAVSKGQGLKPVFVIMNRGGVSVLDNSELCSIWKQTVIDLFTTVKITRGSRSQRKLRFLCWKQKKS